MTAIYAPRFVMSAVLICKWTLSHYDDDHDDGTRPLLAAKWKKVWQKHRLHTVYPRIARFNFNQFFALHAAFCNVSGFSATAGAAGP